MSIRWGEQVKWCGLRPGTDAQGGSGKTQVAHPDHDKDPSILIRVRGSWCASQLPQAKRRGTTWNLDRSAVCRRAKANSKKHGTLPKTLQRICVLNNLTLQKLIYLAMNLHLCTLLSTEWKNKKWSNCGTYESILKMIICYCWNKYFTNFFCVSDCFRLEALLVLENQRRTSKAAGLHDGLPSLPACNRRKHLPDDPPVLDCFRWVP